MGRVRNLDLQIVCYTGHMHTVVKVGRVASGPSIDCGYVPALSHYSGKGPSERTAAFVFDFSVDGLDQTMPLDLIATLVLSKQPRIVKVGRGKAPGPNCAYGAIYKIFIARN